MANIVALKQAEERAKTLADKYFDPEATTRKRLETDLELIWKEQRDLEARRWDIEERLNRLRWDEALAPFLHAALEQRGRLVPSQIVWLERVLRRPDFRYGVGDLWSLRRTADTATIMRIWGRLRGQWTTPNEYAALLEKRWQEGNADRLRTIERFLETPIVPRLAPPRTTDVDRRD